MRSKAFKWIVLSAALLVAAIIIIQLFWLNRVYSFEQKNFNVNVVKSIRGLYEDVELRNSASLNLQTLIEHPQPDYFLFHVDAIPPADTLKLYLKQELEDFDVLTDAYISVYEPGKMQYTASYYLPAAASRYTQDPSIALTVFPRDHLYLLLYFPHRDKYVLSQMVFWFISSGALIIALTALAVSLFFFFRQKFLSQTQKEFLNNVTHEFKTPLAVLKIASGVLAEDDILQKPARLKNYITIVEQQTNHLQQQVERLLTSATTENNELKIQKTPVSLSVLVSRAIRKIQPLADDKKARIDIKTPEQETPVWIDESNMELALINLLENALKYSANPHIIVETGRDHQDSYISVKDNGIGIEKKYQQRIFKKFYRVPTGNIHNVKGFGLGLNFVKQAVVAHKGKIVVNSLPGIGTEFKIILPTD